MVRLFGLLLGFLALPSLASPSNRQQEQGVSDPFAAMAGRWVWIGDRDKHGLEKACASEWTEFGVSADKKTISYRYQDEEKGGKREIKTGSYNVLYQEGNSIAMYLNGEDRKYRNGDRLVWVMQVESPDLFYWRIFTTPLGDEGKKYARVRCPAS